MKSIIACFFLLTINLCVFAQNGKEFTIAGTVKSPVVGKKIYLELNGPQTVMVLDSVEADANKRFAFKRSEKDEGSVYQVNFYNRQRVAVLIEGGEKIEVTADGIQGGTALVKGSKTNDDFQKLMAMNAVMEAKVKKWQDQSSEANKKNDQAKIAKIQGEFEAEVGSFSTSVKQLMATMGTSLAALMATNFINPETDFAIFENLANRFTKERPNMVQGQLFARNVRRMRGIRIGDEAPELAYPSPDGTVKKLSSLRGKVVLIDFWASWCGPCRMENPNVVKAYAKYKDKGFEIYGVSLDSNKDAWIRAIEKDGLTWTHVSDLKQWKSEAAALYSVSGIPAAFLLDKEGKIVATNLRGEALEQKLSELLK